MFIRAFKTKTSTAIRGSDRRKLRAQVEASFPKLDAAELPLMVPKKEEMSVTKISTHSGSTLSFYSVSGEPLFFEVEKRIFPTVYTLWKYPDMLLGFTTWPNVLEKLAGGADLMLPGVILPAGGLDSLEQFEKNTICCVRLHGNNAPVAVGLTTVSKNDMYQDGIRGKGVRILHVFTDFLWAHGSKIFLPQIDVEAGSNQEVQKNVENIEEIKGQKESQENTEETLKDENETATTELSDEACASNCTVSDQLTNENENSQENENHSTGISNAPLTTEEMDDLLGYCFFCALLRLKEHEFPVLTITLYRKHMLSYCPDGKYLDLRKSSHKKLSKYLQSMEERGIIKLQEISKGVDSITAVAFGHEELKAFKTSLDSLPPKPITNTTPDAAQGQQGPLIEEMVSVSGSLAKLFASAGYEKGSVFSLAETRKFVTGYVRANDLVDKNNSRMVVLDPLLTVVVNRSEGIASLTWENLFTRVLNKMNSCYQITVPGQPAVFRKGKIDLLEIKIEQRMGNKKVTLVRNLDAYGIDPQEFAHKIQLKAASSTSVSQLPGKHKTPGMQVLVQGNQLPLVATSLLEDYKIPKKYISGLELLKSQKKKKK